MEEESRSGLADLRRQAFAILETNIHETRWQLARRRQHRAVWSDDDV